MKQCAEEFEVVFVDVSVVLPVYNEERNIPLIYDELRRALNALPCQSEIVFVDDGSRDGSFNALAQIAQYDPSVLVVRFRRNYGQTAAMSAGIAQSTGQVVVLMDADLQNDPADIGKLLAKMQEGYDVVSGWRKHRKDAMIQRKLPSMLANGLISRVTGVRLHDYGCTLKAYRREVLEPVKLYGEMHRFMPALAYQAGAQITEIPVNHRARRFGRSKYGIARTLRVVLDLVTVKFLGSFSTKPMYAFGFVGMYILLASFITAMIAVGEKIADIARIHNNPLTLLSGVLLVVSVQIVLMGLLAEQIMRTYYESQGKKTYAVRSLVRYQPLTDAQTRPFMPDAIPYLRGAAQPNVPRTDLERASI